MTLLLVALLAGLSVAASLLFLVASAWWVKLSQLVVTDPSAAVVWYARRPWYVRLLDGVS